MPGLRRDDDARAAARDDVAELFEHERGAIQIDLEDRRRRRLRGRDAGRMDEAGDVAERGGCLDEHGPTRARRRRRSRCSPRSRHRLGPSPPRRRCPAHVGQQDMLACADPARDRLADRSGSDDDNDVGHSAFSFTFSELVMS